MPRLLVRVVLSLAFSMCVACRTHRLGGVAKNDPDALTVFERYDDATQPRPVIDGYRSTQTRTPMGAPLVVEPGLTEVWAWRPDTRPATVHRGILTVLGGVAIKD